MCLLASSPLWLPVEALAMHLSTWLPALALAVLRWPYQQLWLTLHALALTSHLLAEEEAEVGHVRDRVMRVTAHQQNHMHTRRSGSPAQARWQQAQAAQLLITSRTPAERSSTEQVNGRWHLHAKRMPSQF